MKTIVDSLRDWHTQKPDDTVFQVKEQGSIVTYTYGQLFGLVLRKAAVISASRTSDSAILLYNDTIDFVTSFLACQYVGVVAVPMFFPRNQRHFDRLKTIFEVSGSKWVLCGEKESERISKSIEKLGAQVDVQPLSNNGQIPIPLVDQQSVELSFIQFTSGSTGVPKGVQVSHKNLMHNQKMIAEVFDCNPNSVILSWLPFFHDMGLVGNILHTIYVGCSCILMTPATVMGNPQLWLQAIHDHKVTHSGGPNFIFDLCIDKASDEFTASLDLSSWQVAYNGSEPINGQTISKFAAKFKRAQLSPSALKTCYGLAESTLIVSGGSSIVADNQISSGTVVSQLEVVFYDENTKQVTPTSGEISIAGDSVTAGYWRIDNSEFFIEHEGKQFLRTGDLGEFVDGHLLIRGRLKEMMIVRGQNLFPYDLEQLIASEEDAIMSNGVAIAQSGTDVFVFAELKKSAMTESYRYPTVVHNIDKLLLDTVGFESHELVLLSPRTLPRTSSGKIQRKRVAELHNEGLLTSALYCKSQGSSAAELMQQIDTDEPEEVRQYLVNLLKKTLLVTNLEELRSRTLMELGLSSLKGIELVNRIKIDLGVEIELPELLQLENLDAISEYLISLLWIKHANVEGEEIVL